LLDPTSAGDSKFGELRNLILAVTLSDTTTVKRAESLPELIETVEDSLTVMVAALLEVVEFSENEKVVELEKDGAVESDE
jgi:hypothetical protein